MKFILRVTAFFWALVPLLTQAGVGPQIVQNGRFAIHPDVNATAYSLAAGTDLGAWRSGVPYVNTDTQPARGNVNVQVDNAAYANVTQRTYSDFSPPSTTNPVTSTTTNNTFLLFMGNGASADLWLQNMSVLPNTTYTVTYFASNAAPVGSTGSAPTLQLKATYLNGGTAQPITTLSEATNGTTTTVGFEATTDTWTQYSYSFTTAATTSNVELRLTDTQTGTTGLNYNEVAVTSIVVRAATASAGTAFSCNGAFYQIRQTDNGAVNGVVGNSSRLYIVDRGAATYTTTQQQELGATLNGLSYDPNNGYIYALTYRGNTATGNAAGNNRIAEPSSFVEVVKIGQGGIESLGFAPNLPVAQWAAGTIDRGLNLYVKEQSAGATMYKLDLNSLPVTVTPLTLSTSIALFDMAYDPISGLLYGGDYPGHLYSIDPNTGVVNTISNVATTADPLGSFFFDVAGNLYAYGNGNLFNTNPGAFYYIDKANGNVTTLAATVGRSTNSDGASCINPSEQIDLVKQVGNVATVSGNADQRDVTFNLYLRNTGTVTLPNVQVSDFLWTSGTAANSQNVAFPTATAGALVGNISVNNLDGSNLTANTTPFTGQGTANGAGAVTSTTLAALLNTGTPQVLTAGQRVQITYTVRMTFPAGAVPTTVQYNTAYASNSTSSNPGSRQLATNGTVLPPDDLTANDLSTNGTTYAPTRIAGPVDSSVPTPVTFFPGIVGTVFEDVNYGGGAGRSLAASGGVGRAGVRVELYTAAGIFAAATTTDASGSYAFTNLTAGAAYTVRVVNSGVTSSRLGAVNTLVPVQTYRYNDANRVGGEYPARTDAAANTTSASLASLTTGAQAAESIVTLTLPAGSANATPGVDFGFNFDVVVNTNDTGQGSLRQFLTNANTLGGEGSLAQSGSRVDATGTTTTLPAGRESSIFMIADGNAHAGLAAYNAATSPGTASQLTGATANVGGTVANIAAASPLTLAGTSTATAIYAAGTVLDGTTQTANVGNTNTGTATNATATTVGTDGVALGGIQKSEVEIGGNGVTSVLDVEASGATVRGLALHGGSGQTILTGGSASATGYVFENLIVGATAGGVRPGSNPSDAIGLYVSTQAGTGTLQNSLVAYTGNSGVGVHNGSGTTGTTQLLSNFFVKNGFLSAGGDGITFGDGGLSSGPANVVGNLFSNSNSSGLQFEIGSTSATAVTNNSILNAGTIGGDAGSVTSNLEGAAIVYLSRTGAERGSQADVINKNVISSSQSAGIVVGYGQQNVTISQNNTNANGGLGIDLITTNKNVGTGDGVYGDGDGVTLNNGSDPATATADQPNKGLDFPILTSATIVGTNLVVKGIAYPGVTVELFLRDADTGNFGEGQTYLGGGIENGAGDLNTATTTVTYSGTINGLNQGSDNSNTARGFTFSLPIGSLSAAQLTALNTNGLTGTATLSGGGTSEFSGRVVPNTAPVANTLTNTTLATNSGPVALSPGLSGSTTGTLSTGTANAVASYTILTLPASGTLNYNNGTGIVPVAANTTITAAQLTTLTYTPVPGYTGGPVSFTYNVTDGNGITSTTNNNGGSTTAGPATYTIPLTSAADVTTTLNGPAQLSTGTAAGPYTVTFANVGLAAASTVTRKVALPAGATLTTAQTTAITAQGGSVAGQVIDFGNVGSLAAGASSTFTFSFVAPNTAGTVALTSTTTTTSSEGGNSAPNSSTINATVNAAADVVAIITPIAATVSAGATGAGFNVTFSNTGGLATALGVTRTVQLPAGLTAYGPVAATNNGTYDNATGLVSYTPSPTTLANGSPLTSQITFTAPPSGPVPATASVSTTSFEAGQTANNTASASVGITPAFDLKTTLYGPATAVEGNEVLLNVTTTNAGPSAAPNAVQTVQLIANLTNVFVSNSGSYDSGTGLVTFPALASLPSGQTVANTISFMAPVAGTTLAPKATVTPNTTGTGDTNTANNDAFLNGAATSTNLTITAPTTGAKANAYATISAAAATVAAGSSVTLTVETGNRGPGAASNLVGRVQLLPGLVLTAQPASSSYDTNTGLLTLATVTSQAVGTFQTGTITFNAPASVGNNGTMLFTASVSTATSETVLADNLSATQVTVTTTTDVATTVAGSATATAGQAVTFTATFANNGPGLATSVTRTAQLPAGLSTVVVTDVATNTVVSGAYNSTTGLVTLPALTSQPAGSSSAYTLAFAAPATNFGVRSATSATSPDGTVSNNRSSASTTVSPAADVAVAISGPAVAVIGNPVTYNVTTTNNGPNAATGVATTLLLPANLTGVTVSGTGTYNSGSGLVTFDAAGTLASGASVADFVTFTMPNASGGQLNGVATIASTSTDPIAANNTASTATSVVLTTPATADLVTKVTIPATATANGSLTVTATFTNTGGTAALSVAPTLQLPAGLTVGPISNSGSYNPATGLVTWPIIASQANNATGNQSYTVVLTVPGGTASLRATSAVTSQTSEANLADNQNTGTTTITAAYDAVTSLSGPATSLPAAVNTYTLTATNNGPSTAPSATPSVTLPAGVTPTNISGGGTFSVNTITWPAITNQAPGTSGEVAYTFDVAMPAAGNLALNSTVAASGESTNLNNGATITTTRANQPPVAYNVVNGLQAPRGNTANQLLVAPLAGIDADGTLATYQLTGTLPATAQGVLYYNNNTDGTSGTYVALPTNQPLTQNQANTLRFDPAAGFAGNVFYTYTATDNLGAVGNVATYTIPVGQDNNSVYAATPAKGRADRYVDKNLLAYVVDPNGATYNTAGVFFDVNTSAKQAGTSNGLPTTGTNAVLAPSGSGPAQNPTNALPSGVSFDPATGNFYVDNTKGNLPRINTATTYYFNVTTTDVYGGINLVLAQFTLGSYPLPVELTEFTAKALRNADARLAWTTASEKSNDHFDVERSLNGADYVKMGEVKGQGSKTSPTDYTLTDAGAAKLGSLVYYRLKQVDTDGTSTYSPVRTVTFSAAPKGVISVYPIPATTASGATLDLTALPAGTYQAQLLDLAGRQLSTLRVEGGQRYPLPVETLATGSYVVRVTGTDLSFITKLVKE